VDEPAVPGTLGREGLSKGISFDGVGSGHGSRGKACAYLTHGVRWLFRSRKRCVKRPFKAGWVAAEL
jgi:hypothetical protein